MLLVALIGTSLAVGSPANARDASGSGRIALQRSATVDTYLAVLVNRARARHGFAAVAHSPAVSVTTRPLARKLIRPRSLGALRHDPRFADEVQASCQRAHRPTENVAYRWMMTTYVSKRHLRTLARGLFRGYMGSPPHRAHILTGSATHMGSASMVRHTPRGMLYLSNVMRFTTARSC